MSTQPNILLILTDQQRWDCLGANSPLCRTPHLDRLAAESVNFQRAYSVCPLCTPARAAIYTGLMPHRTGVTRNVSLTDPQPPSIGGRFPTLGERLAKVGYRSVLAGKWHAGAAPASELGFEGEDFHGYGDPSESEAYRGYLARNGVEPPTVEWVGCGYPHRLGLAGVASGPEEAQVPAFLANTAIQRLSELREGSQPYFLAVNFWGPHAPYIPCEPYASSYAPTDFDPWPNFGDTFAGKPPIYRRWRDALCGEGQPPRSWDECARWLALACGFVSQIDAQIGRILEAVRSDRRDEDTLILFSSDHGDLLGAHGAMHDKDGILCDELMRIPLLVRHPQGVGAGEVRSSPVSNLDLAATVLDFAAAPDRDTVDGRSLRPLVEGNPSEDKPVFAQFFGSHFAYEARMVVYGKYKYIFHPGSTDELYDLEEDPWEMNNLLNVPAHVEPLAACRQHLLEHVRAVNDPLQMVNFLFQEHSGKAVVPYVGGEKSLFQMPPRVRVSTDPQS